MSTTGEDLYRIAYGNKMSLPEWKAHFKERYRQVNLDSKIQEYSDVKTFIHIDGKKYHDIKTLIVKESQYYCMKYGSGHSGHSGNSNFTMYSSLTSFNLTDEEVERIVEKYNWNAPILEQGNVAFYKAPCTRTDHKGTYESYTQEIAYNSKFSKRYELFNELTKFANAKFAKKATKKMNTYHIDDMKFEYESVVLETVSDHTEKPLHQFYLFNNDNICHLQLNMNPIQG